MDLSSIYSLSREFLQRKYQAYHRDLLKGTLFDHRLSVISGARGVGKTTLLIQHLRQFVQDDIHSAEILYVPMDHFLLSDHTLYELAEAFYQQGGRVIAFDEIHRYAGWSKELKSIYDTFPSLHLIASGSSLLELYKGSHDLTRRAINHTVPGLSFREYIELTQEMSLPVTTFDAVLKNHEALATDIIQLLAKTNKKILQLFKQYLRVGYYPYFLDFEHESDYFMTVQQTVQTSIEIDLPAVHDTLTGHSIKKIKQLLWYLAGAIPIKPHYQRLKETVDVNDTRTLKTYLKYLEDAHLIRSVLPASTKLNQIETPEKIYLFNANQLYALSQENDALQGTARELFFLRMLSDKHEVRAAKKGDFCIDNHVVIEIGGKNKGFSQIKEQSNAYLACDDLETGLGSRIPLWLFGFLY